VVAVVSKIFSPGVSDKWFQRCFFQYLQHIFVSQLFIIYSVILVILDGGFNESVSSPQNLGLYDLIQLGHFCNID